MKKLLFFFCIFTSIVAIDNEPNKEIKKIERCYLCKKNVYQLNVTLIQMGCPWGHLFHEQCLKDARAEYDDISRPFFCWQCNNISYKEHMYRIVITANHVFKESLFPAYQKKLIDGMQKDSLEPTQTCP